MLEQPALGADALVGAWRLISFEVRGADGRVRYPYGRDATGYLLYSADGHLAVAFGRADRPAFPSADPASGTADHWLASAKGFTAYCGRWELRDDTVVHHVEVSLFPNWVGGKQERHLTRDGDRITLSTPPYPVRGEQRTGHLVWERASQRVLSAED